MSSIDSNALDGIAIVGMSGRFPGAQSVQEFWRNLREGRESISFFTDEELLAEGNDPSVFTAPNYVKARGVLEDIESFDAAFFGFTPREAQVMDPQQRLFFECAWEALETAGYDPEVYRGAIGVFAGVSMSAYLPRIISSREILEAVGSYQILLGNDKDHLPTRVSYKLNLKGPSVNVQTACSTSLVAVHLASQSLLTYQCDMALAGGVSVSVPQKGGHIYRDGGVNSPDGHCRPFDQRAAGTVSGSGCGIVLLKRLSDAIADGDTIQAVIRGSAINNDGSLKVGYTAPSIEGQAEVIALAQAVAGVSAETISYVEAHGTGTTLGDPIEVAALQKAFGAGLAAGSCALGSVKSNVGHLDAAAGVAGLIKTVLALRHRELPPSLHYESANPQIDFGATPFYVNARLKPWKAESPRRAGVSSFGIGGTNAHVIVEEWPQEAVAAEAGGLEIVTVSARTESALAAATAQLATHLKLAAAANGSSRGLEDVAYTLQVGRRGFAHRRAVVCRDMSEAAAALRESEGAAGVWSGGKREVAFMFPGQGAQAVQMSRGIYESEPSYRSWVDDCSAVLAEEIGEDLRALLYPRAGEEEAAAAKLNETRVTQPALFVVEVGLARLWQRWGVRPAALIGHSIGELAAACVAGVMEWREGLQLVAARGRLMQSVARGAMLAVALPEAEVEPLLQGRDLSLAALNGERQSVVSGPTEVIDALERELETSGVMKRRLKTSHAFHSAMMDPVLEEFAQRVAQVQLKPPQIPFISNVTGAWITDEDATSPEYWARQMRATVRLSDGFRELMKVENRLLLEVGPGQTLSDLAKHSPHKTAAQTIVSSSGREVKSDDEALLNAVARLWVNGVAIDWEALRADRSRQRVPLPTYPFERKRFWVDPPKRTLDKSLEPRRHADVADWFYSLTWKRVPAFKANLQVREQVAVWLLFVGRESLGGKLAGRLREAGVNVVTVSDGKSFARLGEGEYEINSTQPGNYAALLEELNAAGRLPTRIVHLWSFTPAKPRRSSLASFRTMQEKGLYSLSLLAQAIARYSAIKHIKLDVVSNNLQDVSGDESCAPEKATLLAACHAIPYEYPQFSCRSIDLEKRGAAKDAVLLDQLFAELLTDTSDAVVAYRHGRRWVKTLEPVRWPLAESAPSCLLDQGVYVLAGEVEDPGLELAEFVAQSAQSCKLILATNREPESFDEATTRRLETLEKICAEVVVRNFDLSSAEDWQRVIADARKRFGRIDGVVYSAADRSPQETRDYDSPQRLESEVSQVLALEKAVREVDLDFCMLLSPVPNGGGAFEVANGMFLDALAQSKNRHNKERWMSVSLDAPASPDKSVSTTASQRVEIFERVLSGEGLAHVIVSPVDPRTRIEHEAPEDTGEQEGAEQHVRPELETNYLAPRNEIERTIAGLWESLLGIERVGVHDDFFALGGHSLAGVQLTFRLREIFKTDDLHLNSLFEAPTVAGLAACVEKACAGIVTLPPILAAMQPAGSKPPFFCVHPIGGDVFGFVDLAKYLAPDQPFYGIQSMGLAEIGMQGDQLIRLEDMAAEYVEAIRQVDPTGPYYIGGWSYGGNVAFEMAHQLRRMGCEVALLVLLDTPAPENFKKIAQLEDVMVFLGLARERARQRGMELNITPGDLPKIKPEDQLEFITTQLKESKLAPLGLDSHYVSNFLRGFKSRMATINNYVPQVYPGRITLFRANNRDVDMQSAFDSVTFSLSDYALDWGRLSTEPVEVHEVDGYHELIVAEPHARLVAEDIKACINQSLAGCDMQRTNK